ncbi:M14 family zinc carboxypeptidase [Pseudoduganella aquatica]|uniref:M14 family zinc carboxypeptidase n=1 Tax=Pseudoduganella aquatica TaxID=2660641 RepID=UPI001E65BAEB|nr:M14 family zinc carboxypeptidase [Pseudoduganella aquatica]
MMFAGIRLLTLLPGAATLLLAVSATAATGTAAPKAAAPAPWCDRLAERLPKVSAAACRESAVVPSGAKSNLGFPILERDIAASAPAGTGAAPLRVLLLGGIHGDELTASALVFHWLKQMDTPAAQSLQWKVAPLVNPDGLLAAKPQRVNARGVDLNRNFPTPGWQQEAPRYWAKATRSDPRRFPGKKPLSEPESRWVNDAIERFQPDLIVSVHAPYGVLDFDGKPEPPRSFGHLSYRPVGVYPGSLGNYSGRHKQVPVITIELPHAQALPPDAEIERIWRDMLLWIQRNVTPA